MFMVRYPNRIKEYRLKRGLTQQKLGLKFAKPKDVTVISRWERGIIRPGIESLLELAHILKVHPDSIYHSEENQKSKTITVSGR